MPDLAPKALRFYGRRHGKKLRRAPQDLLHSLLPQIKIAVPAPDSVLPPSTLFPAGTRAVWLEVGFGGGEHLAAQATANPDIGLIGAEVFVNGVASALRHIDDRALANVRIFSDDVRLLLPALPDGCLEKIFVLFPDPWPKTRHADRRFIGPDTLPRLARLLACGGELRVASDDPTYIAWAKRHLHANPDFHAAPGRDDPFLRPADWPATRYEGKALEQGRPPAYFAMIRRARGAGL